MAVKTIKPAASAYSYPLLIKNLLHTSLVYSPNQEIVYRDKLRYNYLTLNKRVSQLANALESLGVTKEIRWESWIGTATDTLNVFLPFP